MPKAKSLLIKLDLLKPQSNPEKLPVKAFRWLLSSGRYIFVLVEALVLIAFGARFKLDADLAAKKEAIEEQIPYIESLKPYEILIRQTQLKLATIDNVKKSSVDWDKILTKIAGQTPATAKISSINISKTLGVATVHIIGQTPASSDITSFITGLKEDNFFTNVNLASVGLEEGFIKFTIDASTTPGGGKNL
ncbi:PilN domain-containing protein [Candidatus Daviesbacteria bacterium]|nr:PilN domain-containing protein [Candidatus Daviesbacteria bacterium]